MSERERWEALADALAAEDQLTEDERRFVDELGDPLVSQERAVYEELAAAGRPQEPSASDRQRAAATLAAFRRSRSATRRSHRGVVIGLAAAAMAVAAAVLLWSSWLAPRALETTVGNDSGFALEHTDRADREEGQARARRAGRGSSPTSEAEAPPEPEAPSEIMPPPSEAPSEAVEPADPPSSRSTRARPPSASASASDLLGTARRQVAAGELDQALATYGSLRRQHRSSPEAHAANVSMGELELRRGRPKAAIEAFSRYLQGGGGALSEEAHWGKIRALDRLDRERERDAAIDDLRRTHPTSVYLGRASSL